MIICIFKQCILFKRSMHQYVLSIYDSVGKDTFQGSLDSLKVRGYTYTTTGEELLETTGEVFANVEACVLWVQVNHTHPLSQAAQAHVDLEGRKTSGSIVLIP